VPEAKEKDVILNINKDSGIIPDYIHEDYYNAYYYPKEMPLYEFKKTVTVSGLPQWVWVKAEQYKDTPEQRAKLQAAYQALWHDFNRKDVKAVKQKMKHSLYAFAYTTDSTEDEIFEDYGFIERMKVADSKMEPINWQAYEIKIMNKGRMVRFANKSNKKYSPIIITEEDGISGYSPVFSLVNGEFVIVI